MAIKKKCPNCDAMTPNQKKGKSAAGKQRWKCSDCGKQWTEGATKKASAKKTAKKKATPVKKKAAATAKANSSVTVIKVNGNEIKKQKGKLSNDECFDLVSDYFRELTKTNVKRIEDSKGNITVEFQVQTGRKG